MVMSMIRVDSPPIVCHRIIPSRKDDNKQSYVFAGRMHDIIIPWYKRVKLGWHHVNYRTKPRFWYMLSIQHNDIKVYVAAEQGEYASYMRHGLERLWESSTVQEEMYTPLPTTNTDVSEMKLRNHNILSLNADWREDTIPIGDIMSVVREMKEGDRAILAFCFEPYPRVSWSDRSDRGHSELKKGRIPKRANVSSHLQPRELLTKLDDTMENLHGSLVMGNNGIEDAKRRDAQRHKQMRDDNNQRHINVASELSQSTRRKANQPCFKCWIRVAVHSTELARRRIIMRTIANSFNELNGDNELYAKRIDMSHLYEVNHLQLSFKSASDVDVNIMSAEEIGKFIQIPTASLQDQYRDILEFIEHRETDIPERLRNDKGMLLATVTWKGQNQNIYFPVSNHDELCLPHIVIGMMGCGKTQGYGANFAVECIKQGFTCFTIDVAKDEMSEQIGGWCKRNGMGEKFIHVVFGDKPIGLDWCEINGSPRAINRFAAEVLAFFELHGADTGLETKRYIRLAAKTVAAVGGSRLADIIKLFTDDDYLRNTIAQLRTIGRDDMADEWIPFVALSAGMKGKALEPVLNRLDILLGDDYMAECINSPNGLDLRKWINGGYVVCFHVSRSELGAEATDLICAILIAKIWLATLYRQGNMEQTPAFAVMDEPHQFMSSANHWKSMVVESRKWRLGLVWMFHTWEQIPRDLAEVIKSAGPHYHLYTSSKKTYRDLSEEIAPFTIEEAMKTPTHHAINVVRSGGQTIPPFMAAMTRPPMMQK